MSADQHEAPWWKKTTVYQIYPRSFLDTNGDGVGDLKGVLAKLDYLAELGVETLWLTPFFDSPQRDFGYDIRSYGKVAADHGTWADFDQLLSAVHERGMRLVLDMVLNHTSDEHPWFREALRRKDSKERDYYLFRRGRGEGGSAPPTNWRSMIGPRGWHYHAASDEWYFASFLPFQPDLNHRNPDVQKAVLEIVEGFLRKGVDGLRLDIFNAMFKDAGYKDNPPSLRPLPSEDNADGFFQRNLYTINHPDSVAFARTLRAHVDAVPGDPRFLVGEVFGPPSLLRSYCGEMGDGLNLVFLFKTLRTEFSAQAFHSLLDEYEREFAAPLLPTWVLGNHDRARYIERVGNDPRRAKVLATLQLTARGVPFLYQGEEIGMTNLDLPIATALDPLAHFYRFVPPWLQRLLRRKGVMINRDECRTPMQWSAADNAGFSPPGTRPWLPVHPSYPWTNVAAQLADSNSLLSHYRRLLKLRRKLPALHSGSLTLWHPTNLPEQVLGYQRRSGQELVDVLLNFAPRLVEVSLPDARQVIFSTHQESLLLDGNRLRLRPLECVILAPPGQGVGP